MPQTNRTAKGVLGGLLGLVGLSAVAGLLVTATVTPAIAVTGAAATQTIDLFDGLPSYLQVDAPMEPSTIYATAADGTEVELATFYDQNRVPLAFDQLGTNVVDAILSSEDKTFFEHGGINIGATAKALIDNIRGTSSRGASTISQQFVKNVLIQQCEQRANPEEEEDQASYDAKLRECWEEATNATGNEGIQRKLQEMRYALQIEKDFSKNDILLGYLNIANFGGTTYGIEAAANLYFGVPAKELSIAQAATLAGIVQNPNTYRIDMPGGSTTRNGEPANSADDGYALTKDRRDYVLNRLLADGKITEDQHAEAIASPIQPNLHPPVGGCSAAGANAYFCQYVKSVVESDPAFGEEPSDRRQLLRRGGLKIYTSLDLRIQQEGVESMARNAPVYRDDMDFGAAGVALENSTGRVLAMTQNTIFTERQDQANLPGYSGLVYASDYAHGRSGGFPVGSTYKLFTLVDWLENGRSLNEVLNGTAQTFTKWSCNGKVHTNRDKIENYNNGRGSVSTVQRFTEQSLNTGYLAMATRLDVCEINAVADRMGVKLATGGKVTEDNQALYDVLGPKAISPLAMAGAYATVANKGILCTPRAIDKVIGQDGNEMPLPKSSCTQVISPEVAATAAHALRSVMQNGTGRPARPGDGVPVIGKTGTHERFQTMMIEASTNVTTSVWVGNAKNFVPLSRKWHNGIQLSDLRYRLAADLQRSANAVYGGDRFPEPARNLLRTVYTDLPNVVGKSIEEATQILEGAGFQVNVGAPVDSSVAEGLVGAQDPGAGRVAGGATVTISPSNGQAATVPDVAGMTVSAAVDTLHAQGYSNATLGTCTDDPSAPAGGEATASSPAAGTEANKNAPVRVDFRAPACP